VFSYEEAKYPGVIALVAMVVEPGQAADAPKSGPAEFGAYVTQRIVRTIDSGVGKGMIVEQQMFLALRI
jgi:hypothetical protein